MRVRKLAIAEIPFVLLRERPLRDHKVGYSVYADSVPTFPLGPADQGAISSDPIAEWKILFMAGPRNGLVPCKTTVDEVREEWAKLRLSFKVVYSIHPSISSFSSTDKATSPTKLPHRKTG